MDFEGEKVVTPYRTRTLRFAYNDFSWYASRDVYFITQKDKSFNLKYILSLLNSKLYFVWFFNKGKRKGDMMEMYSKPLSEVPIKKISPTDQKPFIRLVTSILNIKKLDLTTDTSDLESEIDMMVYKLYDLTDKEISLVEAYNAKPH